VTLNPRSYKDDYNIECGSVQRGASFSVPYHPTPASGVEPVSQKEPDGPNSPDNSQASAVPDFRQPVESDGEGEARWGRIAATVVIVILLTIIAIIALAPSHP
jgi:hypothetical protein